MDQVWRDAPWAAARVTRRGPVLDIQPNAVAADWASAHGVGSADWRRLAAEMIDLPPGRSQRLLGLSGLTLTCVSLYMPDGLLLWLDPQAPPEPLQQPPAPRPAPDTVPGPAPAASEPLARSPLLRSDTLAEQSRLVAQAMGVGFWLREGSGRPQLWDAEVYRLHGRSPDRPPPSMHEWIDQYVRPEARAEVQARLEADSAAWAPSTEMTVPIRGDDGIERHVRLWTRRYVRDGRRIAMGMQLDVTEQLRAEELQRDGERAARASREKSAFLALMSHRLRTPLNAVLGFAQLLAGDTAEPLTLRQRERLARIDTAGQELLAMLDDVFELAELDADNLSPTRVAVPMAVLLNQLREALGPLARQRGVDLRLHADEPGPSVATDRRLLVQSLQHLVAHAVRRNDRGGWVALAVADDPQAGWARLILTDAGPALTARQRELLFDVPARPEAETGHGDERVGLALVRQALERLGAQLEWARAGVDDFDLVVRLPLALDTGSIPDDTAPAAPLSLMCVEDNPVNLMLVQELVAMRPGVRFLSATDGEAGLALALAERPDVVLLDLHLPGISGTEVMKRLRADPATAGCQAIALSANVVPEDIREALAAGFDDYWTKPIDFDQFLAGLDRLAARARTAP